MGAGNSKLYRTKGMDVITFYQFHLSDVEDPDIYSAPEIISWEQSEQGLWCKEHSTVPVSYRITTSYNTWSYRVDIYGDLKPSDLTFYNLKWGNQ